MDINDIVYGFLRGFIVVKDFQGEKGSVLIMRKFYGSLRSYTQKLKACETANLTEESVGRFHFNYTS